MLNKKGFTLVELLAVLVILIMLALVVMPKVTQLITSSRDKANIESINGMVKAANMYYSEHGLDGSIAYNTHGYVNVTDSIDFDKKLPDEGFILLNTDGEVYATGVYGKYCYYKNFNSEKVSKTEDLSICDYSVYTDN